MISLSSREKSKNGSDKTKMVSISSLQLFKPRHSTNWAWHYFSKGPEATYAYCDLCIDAKKRENSDQVLLRDIAVAYGDSQAPQKLEQHIKHQHKSIYEEQTRRKAAEKVLQSTMNAFVTPIKSREESFMQAYTEWICDSAMAISECERPSFRRMISSVGPVKVHSRITARENLVSTATEYRERLKVLLKGEHVALTSDHWTSNANENYVAVTGHYIDEGFELNVVTLMCEQRTGSASAPFIVNEIIGACAEFGIPEKKISAVVTDTAPTMVKVGRLLRERSISWQGCVDHILELTTGKAFDDKNIDPNGEEIMKKARALVGHFHNSVKAKERLLASQPAKSAVTVLQDVATRWWSTYDMCQRLIRLQRYISVMDDEGELPEDLNLSEGQYKLLAEICQVLAPFMKVQKLLEGEYYVCNSFVLQAIMNLRDGLQSTIASETSSESTKRLSRIMLESFNSYWGEGVAEFGLHLREGRNRRPLGFPLLTMIATFLDPRTKGLDAFNAEDRRMIWNTVEEMLIEIITPDVTANQNENGAVNDEQSDEENENYIPDILRGIDTPDNFVPVQNEDGLRIRQQVSAEMSRYRSIPTFPMTFLNNTTGKREHSDPLLWWRNHRLELKVLSELARRVLNIPPTSAPSERVFSVAGLTISNNRSRLGGDAAAAQIFLQNAYPAVRLGEARKRARNTCFA